MRHMVVIVTFFFFMLQATNCYILSVKDEPKTNYTQSLIFSNEDDEQHDLYYNNQRNSPRILNHNTQEDDAISSIVDQYREFGVRFKRALPGSPTNRILPRRGRPGQQKKCPPGTRLQRQSGRSTNRRRVKRSRSTSRSGSSSLRRSGSSSQRRAGSSSQRRAGSSTVRRMGSSSQQDTGSSFQRPTGSSSRSGTRCVKIKTKDGNQNNRNVGDDDVEDDDDVIDDDNDNGSDNDEVDDTKKSLSGEEDNTIVYCPDPQGQRSKRSNDGSQKKCVTYVPPHLRKKKDEEKKPELDIPAARSQTINNPTKNNEKERKIIEENMIKRANSQLSEQSETSGDPSQSKGDAKIQSSEETTENPMIYQAIEIQSDNKIETLVVKDNVLLNKLQDSEEMNNLHKLWGNAQYENRKLKVSDEMKKAGNAFRKEVGGVLPIEDKNFVKKALTVLGKSMTDKEIENKIKFDIGKEELKEMITAPLTDKTLNHLFYGENRQGTHRGGHDGSGYFGAKAVHKLARGNIVGKQNIGTGTVLHIKDAVVNWKGTGTEIKHKETMSIFLGVSPKDQAALYLTALYESKEVMTAVAIGETGKKAAGSSDKAKSNVAISETEENTPASSDTLIFVQKDNTNQISAAYPMQRDANDQTGPIEGAASSSSVTATSGLGPSIKGSPSLTADPMTTRLGPPRLGPPRQGSPSLTADPMTTRLGPPRLGPPRQGSPSLTADPMTTQLGPPRLGPPRQGSPSLTADPTTTRLGPSQQGPPQSGAPRP